ncbi:hypothetical protein INT48_000483 [Thamnidium elegans]|uniref:Uncharacterized protein n=1 Tax=Thamnidium elegans TaxID=101142 RepID=A0A8H7SQW1_9FUNG|nr:hypothetical protein INT48_000483 [Thamnidium elegans]
MKRYEVYFLFWKNHNFDSALLPNTTDLTVQTTTGFSPDIENVNEDRFTPVVISIQKEVCRASMLEVIRYSTLVYRKYKLLPTVLIIFSKYYSSLDDCEVNINIDSPFTRIESKFWAQDCLLFLPDSVNTPVNSKPTRLQ